MNAQEFKEKYPHLSHLEGNDLWNAMEDALMYEQRNEPKKVITDWKGNIIKEGDEVCLIKIKDVQRFKNLGFLVPDGKGGSKLIESGIPDEPDKDCWEVGETIKIEQDLMYTTKSGGFTITQPISMLDFCIDKNTAILAIKGVSDVQEDYFKSPTNA